jgi:glycosyltransferase involved in cell wall biosynthesis
MKHQKFSVLLPIYNRIELQTTFPNCLQAITSSSIIPSQVVIVVDGPLDWNIDNQLVKYKKKLEITLLKLPQNVGLASALNLGLDKCFYDIVARVDADDFCTCDRFAKQLDCFQKGYNLVGSNIIEIDENDIILKQRAVPQDEEAIRAFALRRNPFNHMSVMFRKRDVLAVGGYPSFHLKEDYALWVLLLYRPSIRPFNIQENLMTVSAGNSMYNRRSSFKILGEEYKFQLFLKKYLNKQISLIVLDLFVRYSFYFLPKNLRAIIYNYKLRS